MPLVLLLALELQAARFLISNICIKAFVTVLVQRKILPILFFRRYFAKSLYGKRVVYAYHFI